MTIYLIILTWSIVSGAIFCLKNIPEKKKTYLLFNFIPLAVITAFRGENVCIDTSMYIDRYFNLASYDWDKFFYLFDYDSRTEYGFALLAKLCGVFSPDSHVLFFSVISVITFAGVGRFYYYTSSNLWLTIVFYYASLLAFAPLMTMRQEAAVAITLSFFPYLMYEDKKKYLYILGVFLGGLIHNAAFLLAILFLLKSKNQWGYNIYRILLISSILIILGVIMYFGFFKILELYPVYYAAYNNSIQTDGSMPHAAGSLTIIIRNVFLYLIPYVGILYGMKKRKYTLKETKICYYCCLALLLTFVFNTIGYNIAIVYRLAMVFEYFTSVALTMFLAIFGRKNLFLKYFYVVMLILYFILRLNIQFQKGMMTDYTIY